MCNYRYAGTGACIFNANTLHIHIHIQTHTYIHTHTHTHPYLQYSMNVIYNRF